MESGWAGAQRFPTEILVGTSKGTGPQGRGARGDPLSWRAHGLSAHGKGEGELREGDKVIATHLWVVQRLWVVEL